jgi:hypothetical protein
VSHVASTAVRRIDAVQTRLRELAQRPAGGLTEPEPTTGERWEAGQVWGHLAEFPGYWIEQIDSIVASGRDTPPFGRAATDPVRLTAIEQGRRQPRAALVDRAMEGIAAARGYLAGLTDAQWSRRGRHPVRGVLDVAQIVERFVVGHLEEHADQLEALARSEAQVRDRDVGTREGDAPGASRSGGA